MRENPKNILERFKGKRIIVLGDVMIDRYINGAVHRISPEAPVPVVLHKNSEDRLGGAANVALNLRALGAEPILVSVLGRDGDAEHFLKAVESEAISKQGLMSSPERKSTVKTRIIGNYQQMLRIDSEDSHDLSELEEGLLFTKLKGLLAKADALIFQDYNKGVLSASLIEKTVKLCAQLNIPTSVDPKQKNFFAFKGVSLFKPNLKEVRESVPFQVEISEESLQKAADYLRQKLGQTFTMITLSEHGVFIENGGDGKIYPTVPRNVADVSGAGDTVISIATLGLIANMDVELLAAISNLAGGQVCEYIGVVPVKPELLEIEIKEHILS